MNLFLLVYNFLIFSFGLVSIFNIAIIYRETKENVFIKYYGYFILYYMLIVLSITTYYFFDKILYKSYILHITFFLSYVFIAFTFYNFMKFICDFYNYRKKFGNIFIIGISTILLVSGTIFYMMKFEYLKSNSEIYNKFINSNHIIYLLVVFFCTVISIKNYNNESIKKSPFKMVYRKYITVLSVMSIPFFLGEWLFARLPPPISDFAPAQLLLTLWSSVGITFLYQFNKIKFSKKEKNVYDVLSDKELEIVKMICNGLSSKEIGFQIKVTEGTVRNKISSVYKKTGCVNRIELLEKFRG